jgi:hypothetical protein
MSGMDFDRDSSSTTANAGSAKPRALNGRSKEFPSLRILNPCLEIEGQIERRTSREEGAAPLLS